MYKIRKNDTVLVISGKDKGRTGSVLSVVDDRVLVKGLNIVKRHRRPNPRSGTEGGVFEKECGIHLSNVMLVDPVSGRAGRVKIARDVNGAKVRLVTPCKSKIALSISAGAPNE